MKSNLAQKPLKIQLFLGLVMVAIFATQQLWLDALYGVFLGLANVGMLALTFKAANHKAKTDAKQGVMILYLSAVIRFILLAVLFVIGLAWLKMNPMAVVLTFVVMQLGQMANLHGKRRLTD
ncbi:ATP synthase subunit I [Galenea microaerophila]